MDYLPVFLDLRNRPTLVVGGGDVALRKVELLLSAGARVRIVAPRLHAGLLQLLARGSIEHVAEEFEDRHAEGAAFIVAATDRRGVNQAVAAAGSARGTFVNVVDDATASSALMPAIIDRSPLLIAVGTAGQSPTLARRVRSQLEALLPERLGALARWAGAMRERVRRALPQVELRRRFWEQLFDGAIANRVLSGRLDEAERLLSQELQRAATGGEHRGEVYLIGAGPGDPDLLTLRALQLLQQADVILHDRLVSDAVLARARRDAQRVFVGKETGRHRVTQERIHALMLDYAQRGMRVARLKGGDPFVFGRGGEEIEVLARAGIPVTVVPGITAALGAAASAVLPLTQRGLAQSVTFVTAMGEGAEALDWRALAAPMQTVVFYMGVMQLPRIVERLRDHGAPVTRAAAIVERATLPEQRVVAGTLADIAQRANAERVSAPALLIVGDVAARAAVPGASVVDTLFESGTVSL